MPLQGRGLSLHHCRGKTGWRVFRAYRDNTAQKGHKDTATHGDGDKGGPSCEDEAIGFLFPGSGRVSWCTDNWLEERFSVPLNWGVLY